MQRLKKLMLTVKRGLDLSCITGIPVPQVWIWLSSTLFRFITPAFGTVAEQKNKNMKKTKKKLMLLLALLTFSVATYAQKGLSVQIIAEPGMCMGGKYEVPTQIYSTSSWTKLKSEFFNFGINTGASVGYNFDDKKGVSLGLLYSFQEQNYKLYHWNDNGNSCVSKGVNLNYLKIPIQFNYITSPEKNISFTFSAGFYLAVLLGYYDVNNLTSFNASSNDFTSAKGMTLIETDNSGTTSNAAFLSKPYKSGDFGGILSAGLQFKLSDKIYLPVMLNYQIGFKDVKNESSQYTQSNSSNAHLFWQYYGSSDPNETLPFRNSTLGLKIGLKIKI